MRRILTLFLLIILVGLSGCTNTNALSEIHTPYDVTYPGEFSSLGFYYYEGIQDLYYYDLLEYSQDDLYVRIYRLYNNNYDESLDSSSQAISGYAFQIVSETAITLSFTDPITETEILTLTTDETTPNVSDAIPNWVFNTILTSGSTVELSLIIDGINIYTDSFTYYNNEVPANLDEFLSYKSNEPSIFDFYYIPLIVLFLGAVAYLVYWTIYRKLLNKSLQEQKSFNMIDIGKMLYIIVGIIVVLSGSLMYLGYQYQSKQVYDHSYIDYSIHVDFYANHLNLDDLGYDLSAFTLQEVQLRENDGVLVSESGPNTLHSLTDVDYSSIQSDTYNILNKLNMDENELCEGMFCILFGPMPAIQLVLVDGDVTIKLEIGNGAEAMQGNSYVIIEITTSDQFYYKYMNGSSVEIYIKSIYDAMVLELDDLLNTQ